MAKKDKHVSETPATAWLRSAASRSANVYEYVEHGGTAESAKQLGVDEHAVSEDAGDAGTSSASR